MKHLAKCGVIMISTTKPSRCPVHKSVVSDVTSVGLSPTVFQEFSARPFCDLPTCRGEWERAQNSSVVTFSTARANSDLGMKSQGPFTKVRTVKSGYTDASECTPANCYQSLSSHTAVRPGLLCYKNDTVKGLLKFICAFPRGFKCKPNKKSSSNM